MDVGFWMPLPCQRCEVCGWVGRMASARCVDCEFRLAEWVPGWRGVVVGQAFTGRVD